MPYKKTHPGLDEAMSQEALDRFMAGATEWEEAPPRPWPLALVDAARAWWLDEQPGRS